MDFYINILQNNLLAIVAIVVTIILIYHYLIERDSGVKLSKRYRNSIFEAQSKIFLNATQYLISGNKDLAIKEFLNAVDINRETTDAYFALGGLYRSNGEIEKAISIHRSLIARENISETTRLRSLKELAFDFDRGGLIDKAIETYRDVLKINRDQQEVVRALCRIYEDIGDWDEAYNYRLMLSKVGQENQSENISHVLVEKAKAHFSNGDFFKCSEELEDAFRYAPTVSAKILWLKLYLVNGDIEKARYLLVELLNEHPTYTTCVFVSLEEKFKSTQEKLSEYAARIELLKNYFLELTEDDVTPSPAIVLTKVRLLKEKNQIEKAYQLLEAWIKQNKDSNSEALKIEYIKLLIDLKKIDDVLLNTQELLDGLKKSLTKHYCKQCGYNSDELFWRCPQCQEWDTIQFRWKV